MKKLNACLLILLLIISNAFFSCTHIGRANMGDLRFDSLALDEQTHLFADTTKPACHLTVKLTYVASSTDEKLTDSLNTYLLSACLGPDYQPLAPAEAVAKYSKAYADTYRSDLEPTYLQDLKDSRTEGSLDIGAWYNYYKNVRGSVQSYRNHLLTYRVDYSEYTGGAHGIYTSSFINLDLRTLLPLRLDDLFAPDYREALTDILWNQLMADHQATTHEELEEMGYATTGDLEPTENFYFDATGITFYYNVYEIAPYAMGPVSISIPYEAIQHLWSGEKP